MSGTKESINNSNVTADQESAAVDLNTPGMSKIMARKISEAIDTYCKETYDDGHRSHLGASMIGRECSRELWYSFRWVLKSQFDGRMQRLFNRGHREEDRFIEWLEGVGFKVWTHDKTQPPKEDGSYPQYRISAVNGHFGGSLDGIAMFPPGWGIDFPVLLEFKTNGTGPKFNKLLESGMAINKPEHFAQTCTYGADENYKFEWVLYLNINKNDDSIHIELVKLDWNLGQQMKVKADRIINTQVPPPRLSDNPTFTKCKWCDLHGICHMQQAAERNCRSCINAVPVENAQWICAINKDNGPIPKDFIKVGCDMWTDITMVPGNLK